MSEATIIFTGNEAQTLKAAIAILQKKLQEEGGAVSTAAPARKGKRAPNQAAIDSVVSRRQQRFNKQ